MHGAPLSIDFTRPPQEVARQLIGATFLCHGTGGLVVETEAYDADDPASHSFSGKTRRNASMFGPPGTIYVYLSYGMHHCVNLVCGEEGYGAAVLIRAIEPLYGIELMQKRRKTTNAKLLCSGPGRVCQALGITLAENGHSLYSEPFSLTPATSPVSILCGPRIGISKATEKPWRFGLAGSTFISRTFLRKQTA